MASATKRPRGEEAPSGTLMEQSPPGRTSALADIFISYQSSDRPRAEVLRGWFVGLGWSGWIDRESVDHHLKEVRRSFSGLLERLNTDASVDGDDREGILHRMVEDLLDQLELLAPNPGLLR